MSRLPRMILGKETDAAVTRLGVCMFLVLSHAVAVHAQPSSPIVYIVRFPSPQSHYVEVEAEIPTQGQPRIEVMIAVWAPGSYLVREFARNLESADGTNARRVTAEHREFSEESLARRHRRCGDGRHLVSALLP